MQHGENSTVLIRVRDTLAPVAPHRYELDVLRCRATHNWRVVSSLFTVVHEMFYHSDVVFESGSSSGFKGAVNHLLYFPELCFPCFL